MAIITQPASSIGDPSRRCRPGILPPSRSRRRRPSCTLGLQQLEPRFALAAVPVSMILVPVGNPGNAADASTGYGRVNNAFQIGKYEVTIGEYAVFLNAVAASDTNGLYNLAMGPNDQAAAYDKTSAGIERTGSSGSYVYTAIGPDGVTPAGADDPANRPATQVNWFDAARFANWMANGQPTGAQNSTTTENGAYDLSGSQALAGSPPPRNATNPNTAAPPTFFLPLENQWYKAAFYSQALKGGRGGYYRFATQSNATPGNIIGSGPNQVNYINSDGRMAVTQEPFIDPDQNNLTNVGAMSGSTSFYGTFDQNGNVWELLDTGGTLGGNALLRGGAWTSFTSYLSSAYRLSTSATTAASNAGFRLAAPAAAAAQTVVIDMVPVGDAGNGADPATGFGAVAADYSIAQADVTIRQYASFLNAVAKADPHGLYNPKMASDRTVAGIARSGTPGNYSYSVMNVNGNTGDRPIAYVSWFDAARFANWMANGQPKGPQTARTTENGGYNLAASKGGRAVPKNAINPNTRAAPTHSLPTENQWYKAAYYAPAKGGVGTPGYWLYATQSDVAPGNLPPDQAVAPSANYIVGVDYCVTQSSLLDTSRSYLTDVGAFADSGSHYGTLNQNGSLYQWNDLSGAAGLNRGLRGGFWAGGAVTLRSTTFTQVTAVREANDTGFRLVGPATVGATRAAAAGTSALDRAAFAAAVASLVNDPSAGKSAAPRFGR